MDSFCEQVVKKKNGAKSKVVSALLILFFAVLEILSLMLFFVNFEFFWILFTVITAVSAVAVLSIVLPRINNVEFDYSVVGNKLKIDKVINKASRKKYLSVDINMIEDLDVIKDDNIPNVKFSRTKDCSSGELEGSYYCVYREPGVGKCLLIFSPNEKILKGMRPSFNHEMMLKFTRRR